MGLRVQAPNDCKARLPNFEAKVAFDTMMSSMDTNNDKVAWDLACTVSV